MTDIRTLLIIFLFISQPLIEYNQIIIIRSITIFSKKESCVSCFKFAFNASNSDSQTLICYLLHLLNLVHDTNLKYITTKLLLRTKSTTALQKNNPTNVDTTRQVLIITKYYVPVANPPTSWHLIAQFPLQITLFEY